MSERVGRRERERLSLVQGTVHGTKGSSDRVGGGGEGCAGEDEQERGTGYALAPPGSGMAFPELLAAPAAAAVGTWYASLPNPPTGTGMSHAAVSTVPSSMAVPAEWDYDTGHTTQNDFWPGSSCSSQVQLVDFDQGEPRGERERERHGLVPAAVLRSMCQPCGEVGSGNVVQATGLGAGEVVRLAAGVGSGTTREVSVIPEPLPATTAAAAGMAMEVREALPLVSRSHLHHAFDHALTQPKPQPLPLSPTTTDGSSGSASPASNAASPQVNPVQTQLDPFENGSPNGTGAGINVMSALTERVRMGEELAEEADGASQFIVQAAPGSASLPPASGLELEPSHVLCDNMSMGYVDHGSSKQTETPPPPPWPPVHAGESAEGTARPPRRKVSPVELGGSNSAKRIRIGPLSDTKGKGATCNPKVLTMKNATFTTTHPATISPALTPPPLSSTQPPKPFPSTTPPKPTRLSELEQLIRTNLRAGNFFLVGIALREINADHLYEPRFRSVYHYVKHTFNFCRRTTNTYICAATVYESIVEDQSLPIPVSISHIRSLHKFEPNIRRTIWKQACDTAPSMTEEHIVSVTVKYESGLTFSDLSNELYTPVAIISAAKRVIGKLKFDLDPASCTCANNHADIAQVIYTEEEDGLSEPWWGDVWLSPPSYGSDRHQAKSEYEEVQVKLENGETPRPCPDPPTAPAFEPHLPGPPALATGPAPSSSSSSSSSLPKPLLPKSISTSTPYSRQWHWFTHAAHQYHSGRITSLHCLLRLTHASRPALRHYPHCILSGKPIFTTPTRREKVFSEDMWVILYLGPNTKTFCETFNEFGLIPGYNGWSFTNPP